MYKGFARNMLFARAMSNGARWFTPDVFGGPVYTPDELGAEVNEQGEVVGYTGNGLPFVGFLWTREDGYTLFEAEFCPLANGQALRPNAINDLSEVIGFWCEGSFSWSSA